MRFDLVRCSVPISFAKDSDLRTPKSATCSRLFLCVNKCFCSTIQEDFSCSYMWNQRGYHGLTLKLQEQDGSALHAQVTCQLCWLLLYWMDAEGLLQRSLWHIVAETVPRMQTSRFNLQQSTGRLACCHAKEAEEGPCAVSTLCGLAPVIPLFLDSLDFLTLSKESNQPIPKRQRST